MTETPTPLPCPFCGGEAEVESQSCGWRVACQSIECATQGPWPTDCTEIEALTAWNTRADSHHRLIEALREIQRAILEGRVCDDVAWFDRITTLHDYIEDVLHPSQPAAIGDLFPDTAALKEARHG